MVIGMLMNAVNETDLSIDELIVLGFNPVAVQVLEVLMRRENEEYFTYIMRLADYPICRFLKTIELEERLSKINNKDNFFRDVSRALHALEGYSNDQYVNLEPGENPKAH